MYRSHLTISFTALATALLLAGCGPHDLPGEARSDHQEVELSQAELTRVELRIGAGKLKVAGGAAKLMEGDFLYNVESWKPVIEHRSTGSRADLSVHQGEGLPVAGNTKNEWDVRLNETAPMDLVINLGAGEADFVIGGLNLRSVQVDMGVGEAEMDLRGTPKRSYDVRINGGVGEAKIHLPAGVGVIATASGGIGDIKVSGLEERNGRWIRSGEESNPIQIRLDVKGGIGEIDID